MIDVVKTFLACFILHFAVSKRRITFNLGYGRQLESGAAGAGGGVGGVGGRGEGGSESYQIGYHFGERLPMGPVQAPALYHHPIGAHSI